VPDWAATIARQVLYEQLDEERLTELKASDDPDVAGLAAKIDREEAYHRMHAQMWSDRLSGEPRFQAALDELRPQLEARGEHTDEFERLWEEMTSVRRSVTGATW
jgi:1,2-phenylacetyl-CoA epoxidase catalytic subunit